MGIGDWGLGIGDWGQGPNPNPHNPMPHPQFPKNNLFIKKKNQIYNKTKIYKILNYNEYLENNKTELNCKNIGSLKGHNREITLLKVIGDKII